MFGYFYHEIFRKTIISFGNIFNNIEIHHTNNDNNTVSIIKVPLAYGPIQKFLARIEQDPSALKPVKMTLPRMSFEFVGLNYDASRKVSTTQTFITNTGKKVYMPVPYNMQFEVNVITKLNDDALQIVEQILPYFQPSYNLTVKLVEPINEKRDIPIILDSVSFTDDYEGDYSKRRSLVYTLRFTAKTYLFGPIPSSSTGIIKKVTLDYMSGTESKKREMRYTVTPRAIKDYDNDSTTMLVDDIDELTKYITVGDSTSINSGTRIYLDSEIMYVESKSDNKLVVIRGYEDSKPQGHISGTAINLLTENDDDLIEYGDDFGFNEDTTFFQDFKEYSPSQNTDL
jgi:hypothetical protein